MRLVLLSCFVLLFVSDAPAHRLDEYLQATRIAVATNRIDLSIDFTPGVAVANQVMAVIDQDGDGHLSDSERATYGQSVLKDIRVEVDERVVSLRVVDVTFPALHEIKGGLGVIRIKATASIEHLTTGSHALTLSNAHHPAISVYLVNALVPKDPAIKITKQTRDELQVKYRLEFIVGIGSR